MVPRLEATPHHEVLGDGRTVVVAGGVHLDHGYLRPWLDPLAEEARLVYYDHRGTGRSRIGTDPHHLDHDLWVGDIERLREALALERFVLFGHSYGGFLAQEYALTHPQRLEGLILCATAPAMDYPEIVMANAAAGGPELLAVAQKAFGGPLPDDAAVGRVVRGLLPLYFHDYDPAVGEELDRRSLYSATAFNRGFFECLPSFSTVGRWSAIRLPVLLLAGRHDWICPLEQGAGRLHAEIPSSRLTVFEASGHYPFVEEPERFRTEVLSWLQGLESV